MLVAYMVLWVRDLADCIQCTLLGGWLSRLYHKYTPDHITPVFTQSQADTRQFKYTQMHDQSYNLYFHDQHYNSSRVSTLYK